MPLTKSAMAPMRYGDIASPNAWLTKICVALAKLLRVGMTIYSVISLTMAQLQLSSNPEKIKIMYGTYYFYAAEFKI